MKKSNVSFISQMCKLNLMLQNFSCNKNHFININYNYRCSNTFIAAFVTLFFYLLEDKSYLRRLNN